MKDTIKHDIYAQIVVGIFFLLSIWWIFINLTLHIGSIHFQLFAALYGIVALLGAVIGMQISRQWGGFNSLIGKAIFMFSLGLIAQEFGQIMYSYYIFFLHLEVPYPSLGDIGYFGSIPLYIAGIYLLAKAAGVKVGLQSFENKAQAILIPVFMLAFSYFFFLREYSFDGTNLLKTFLDFGYPLGQAIYVSIAILTLLLSRKVLGGIMKTKVQFILTALVIQYIADYTFLYQSSRGIWAAGKINDYIYLIAYLTMTLAILQFKTVYVQLKRAKT